MLGTQNGVIIKDSVAFQEILNGLPDAVYTCDDKGKITFFNQAAENLWGRKPSLNNDMWCGSWKIFHSDGSQMKLEDCPMAIALKKGEAVDGQEILIERPDGDKRNVMPHPIPVFDEMGKLTGAVNTLTDITEKRLTEKKAVENLLDSETYHLQMIQALPAAVYTCDAKGRITFYNKAAADLWGREPILGKDEWCGSWKIYNPDDLSPVALDTCPMAIALKEGREVIGEEILVERPDGQRRHVQPYPKPIFNREGKVIGAVNTLIDITEHKIINSALLEGEKNLRNLADSLERKVEERTSQLSKKNEELEQFASIASHDLQEPLRKIQIFSEIVEDNQADPSSVKKNIARIKTSAARMSLLIKDILNYSRFSINRESFDIVDLNSILRNIKLDYDLQINQKNAVIINSKLPSIHGSEVQLQQLFSNLISNSLKFNESNPVIKIIAEAATESEIEKNPLLKKGIRYTRFTVIDNGIGFDPKYSEQVFNLFQRLHDRSQYSGTGIGLALCKKIVENHQGLITVKSELNKGTTFTIYLPS